MRLRLLPFVIAFAFSTLLSLSAFADKVAVLAFLGNATKEQLDQARTATLGATMQKAHSLATDSELITAHTAVADGGHHA